eukprot:624445-Amphidinium_carterae.1
MRDANAVVTIWPLPQGSRKDIGWWVDVGESCLLSGLGWTGCPARDRGGRVASMIHGTVAESPD